MKNKLHVGLISGFLILIITSCATTPSTPQGGAKMSLDLTSSAFEEEDRIPEKYTCDGPDLSPPLAWSGVPQEAESLALIVDDPDAPMGTWVHWVLFNLPPETSALAEDTSGGGKEGVNDFNRTGYGGPCPPPGKPHRYFFKLYALDTTLDLGSEAKKKDVLNAMEGHILAQGQLMGTFSR